MKKIVIPVILTVTILIAGIFAFMPIDKASTVHTSIQTTLQGSQTQIQALTLSATAIVDDQQIEIECGASAASDKDRQFIVKQLILTTATNADGNEVLEIDAIEVDGVSIKGEDNAAIVVIDIMTGGTANTGFSLVPGAWETLAADGELDLIQNAAGTLSSSDTVSGTAIILADGNTVCAFTAGTDD